MKGDNKALVLSEHKVLKVTIKTRRGHHKVLPTEHQVYEVPMKD